MKIVNSPAEIAIGDAFQIPLSPNLVSEVDYTGPDYVWSRLGEKSWSVQNWRNPKDECSFGGDGEGNPDFLFDDVKEFRILDSSDLQQIEELQWRSVGE